MSEQIKTLKINLNDPQDRIDAFDRICELRCLDKEKARVDLKITGKSIPHQKILELSNKQDCSLFLSIEVKVKPVVGAAAIKAPDGIPATDVDQVIPHTSNQAMNSGFSEDQKMENGLTDEPFEDDSDPPF